MAKLAVIHAVEGVLSAWPECPPRKAVNDLGEVDGTGTLFLMVEYPVANGSRQTHGRDFAEEGAARILIHAERGSGLNHSIEIGEAIARLFRGHRIEGIDFHTPTSPLVNDGNDDGLYFKTSVVVPYTYYYDDAEGP